VEVKALTYLILLMSSLGMEINLQNVERFRQKIAVAPDTGDSEILESLILLWNSASKQAGKAVANVVPRDAEIIFAAGSVPQNVPGSCSECAGNCETIVLPEKAAPQLQPSVHPGQDNLIPDSPATQPSLTNKPEPTGQAKTMAPIAQAVPFRNEAAVPVGTPPQNFEIQPDTSGPSETEQNSSALLESGAVTGLSAIAQPDSPAPPALAGRYIYGIGWGDRTRMQIKGLGDAPVYGIGYRDIVAIVHRCEPQPYQSENRETALEWIQRHQEVLDQASSLYQSVLPVGFDVIIDGTESGDPDQVVRDWLIERYEPIVAQLQRLSGKTEYGIKLFSSPEKLIALAHEKEPKINELEQKITAMSKGTAYLIRNQLSHLIRDTVDEIRGEIGNQLKELLTPIVVEFKEENVITKPSDNQLTDLIASLTVLTVTTNVEKIGTVLEDFQNRYDVTVEFTGPWPPYSFVENFD
jgi:hypothetical protein